jgi:hypothetical protein
MLARALASLSLLALPGLAHADIATLTPVADAWYASNAGQGGFGSGASEQLLVGSNNNGDPRRAVLQFDLGSIPPGSVVSSVELVVTGTFGNNGGQLFDLYEVLEPWTEGPSN